MANDFSADVSGPQSRLPRDLTVWSAIALGIAAVVYGFLAGLHTLQDFDLGWQLATGRWVAQHHRIFSADVFSYTAAGQPWIYPALSGVIFYITYLAGGYALLSGLGAIASAGCMSLMVRPRNLGVSALAVLAVPLIANRTQPRAEMFTTILFAAFLALLWKFYRTGRSQLWLLPVLMVLWVNQHPGFVAGLGMCGGYLLLEALDLPSKDKRGAAVARLRRAWPWLVGTGVATLLNPWGLFIYAALVRQARAQALHNLWVLEWESVRLSAASVHQALDWRDPQSSFWWLMVAGIAGVVVALWRRQWGAALLLAGAAYLAMQHVRLQALFACVAVVVTGSVLEEFVRTAFQQRAMKIPTLRQAQGRLSRAKNAREMGHPAPFNARYKLIALVMLTTILVFLTGVRCVDLISNRYYLRSSQLTSFGAGLSWWFPERAVEFVQREHLPGNIFNGYSLGGYLTWRLFPDYPDYIDSRALPFGPELFFRAYDLAAQPPGSVAWQQEADARGINTILVPLARYQGMTLFPQLHAFCRSTTWRPVYLDEVSGVFVRATPQNASLLERAQIDCDQSPFSPPGASRAAQFNFWANAGGVLYSLERYPEALEHLDRAQSISGQNASVHLLRGLVLEQMGRAGEAEAEFRTSLTLEPSDEAWMDLGLFYIAQRRYADAVNLFRSSAESSARPHEMWMMLGQAYLDMHQPQPALDALDKAVESSPFHEEGEALGASFNSLVATGRAKAWYQLGDIARAVSYQEEAVQFAPNDAKLWLGLSNLYEVQGRVTKAAEARMHAARE